MKNIMQMDPEPIPEHFSDSMKALVNKLLNKNPNSRPSIKEILKYDFVVKKLKYRKNKIMIRPPSIAPIRKVSADKKTEKEMFNQDSFKADEYRKTKLKINIEEDEENNQIAHSGNIPNLENDNKSPFNKIMSGGGPHHRQTQSYVKKLLIIEHCRKESKHI